MLKAPCPKIKGRAHFISVHLPAVPTVLTNGFAVGF